MSDSKQKITETFRDGAIIKVVGVGGGGSNAVNNMVKYGIKHDKLKFGQVNQCRYFLPL